MHATKYHMNDYLDFSVILNIQNINSIHVITFIIGQNSEEAFGNYFKVC